MMRKQEQYKQAGEAVMDGDNEFQRGISGVERTSGVRASVEGELKEVSKAADDSVTVTSQY
jgi:hypothetical protein